MAGTPPSPNLGVVTIDPGLATLESEATTLGPEVADSQP